MYFIGLPSVDDWDYIESRGSCFLDDLEVNQKCWWPKYDDIIEEISGMMARGDQFRFHDRMEYNDGQTNVPEGCLRGYPTETLVKVHRTLERNSGNVPHTHAGMTCTYLGIVRYGSSRVRDVSYEFPTDTTKRGYKKARMPGRYFLKWARPFED